MATAEEAQSVISSSGSDASETVSVRQLRREFEDDGEVAAGQLVRSLLLNHGYYVDTGIREQALADAQLAQLGPPRPVGAHLDTVRSAWDEQLVPMVRGRHVILGLALDPGIGWNVLAGGIVSSLLDTWENGPNAEEPRQAAWDVLSDSGRRQAEEQPLLAAAFGAPAEVEIALERTVQALAWSPGGERLAISADGTVYEWQLGARRLHSIGRPGETAGSIGWNSREGVVGLSIAANRAVWVRASDGSILAEQKEVSAGLLSGDASQAWLRTPHGILRQAASGKAIPGAITSPSQELVTPVAVDWSGDHGLLQQADISVLVSAPPASPRAQGADPRVSWPDEAAPMIGSGPAPSSRCALVRLGARIAAAYATQGSVEVWSLPGNLVCRIATGPYWATALAADPDGTSLAVGVGNTVMVWPLGRAVQASTIPAYDSDSPDQPDDLLGTGRDAEALATLISAEKVEPPLSIGLFGAWGSGKSFILREITRLLEEGKRPAGSLQCIKVVEFSAWQYAETNLWASLVDRVFRVIIPAELAEPQDDISEAKQRAQKALTAAEIARGEVNEAAEQLNSALAGLSKQRRRAARLGAILLALAATAIVATLFGDAGRIIAIASTALALLGAAAGILDRAKTAEEQADDLAKAGTRSVGWIGRSLGQPEKLVTQAKAELTFLEARLREAEAAAGRLQADARELELEQPVGALLNQLAGTTVYRDELGIVARTRRYFEDLDARISRAREERDAASQSQANPASAGPAPSRPAGEGSKPDSATRVDRVIVIIDDLDRCPPDKVVNVLEAVQLLFSFRMFVVLIAVDTRWLELSLRIHYHRLLGEPTAPVPADYLEKIIQIPLHVLPLDESKIQLMISGLTGTTPGAAPRQPERPQEQGSRQPQEPGQVKVAVAGSTRRSPPPSLDPQVLQVTAAEAAALSVVAPLIGSTPRTVKRFVNSYRLLKAMTAQWDLDDEDPQAPDHLRTYQMAAFLLAVVTGQPTAAPAVFSAFLSASSGTTAGDALAQLLPDAPTPAQSASADMPLPDDVTAGLIVINAWLHAHPLYNRTPAQQYAAWAIEAGVARFSFTQSYIHPVSSGQG